MARKMAAHSQTLSKGFKPGSHMGQHLSHITQKLLACVCPLLSALAAGQQMQNTATSDGYAQPYRPQVHFSPQTHWTNDPNGLIFDKGEYHLFYQYNPFGDTWGHMSWGQAVSPDLLHWHELPVAIPEHDGTMIFTGSVVADTQNTSGLCHTGADCLVAIYTGASKPNGQDLQNQNLAYSQDRGRTWKQFSGNPVLDLHMSDFRDPSVSWNPVANSWVMAVSLPKEHKIRFYRSPDLKHWTVLSDFGPAGDTSGDWECPDLLHIPGDRAGNPGIWALKVGLNPGAPQGGSGEQYFLGSFDGKQFVPSSSAGSHGWTNYGKDDYCAISYNGLPPNRPPVLIGWMSNWDYAREVPTFPWRGQMSLPRKLSYVEDAAGLSLRQQPVVAPLREKARPIAASLTASTSRFSMAETDAPFELQLTFSSAPNEGAPAAFGVRLYTSASTWTEVGFDRGKQEFYVDRLHSGLRVAPSFPARTSAPLAPARPFTLDLVVDHSSVEAYAQDGTIAMTDLIFPPGQKTRIELFGTARGGARVSGSLWKLQSIWNAPSEHEPSAHIRTTGSK